VERLIEGSSIRRLKEKTMTRTIIIPAFLLSMTAISTAAAAEPFNGPHVGVQAGWTKSDIGAVESNDKTLTVNRSKDTYTGGIFAGYDRKLSPSLVVGVEAGFSVSGDDKVRSAGTGTVTSLNPKHALNASARVGFLATPSTLVYARGGYETLRASITSEAAGKPTLRDTKSLDGWLVGGGVEHALTDTVSTRIEYRYSDLGGEGSKFERHQVLAGLAYRF
jgi:outer membrane immunogenic protein